MARHSRPPWYRPKWAKVRLALFTTADFTCVVCGWAPDVPEHYDGRRTLGELLPGQTPSVRVLEIDHIVPLDRGGTHDLPNLQVLCSSCNASKGTT